MDWAKPTPETLEAVNTERRVKTSAPFVFGHVHELILCTGLILITRTWARRCGTHFTRTPLSIWIKCSQILTPIWTIPSSLQLSAFHFKGLDHGLHFSESAAESEFEVGVGHSVEHHIKEVGSGEVCGKRGEGGGGAFLLLQHSGGNAEGFCDALKVGGIVAPEGGLVAAFEVGLLELADQAVAMIVEDDHFHGEPVAGDGL
jgi:hypothetical protein